MSILSPLKIIIDEKVPKNEIWIIDKNDFVQDKIVNIGVDMASYYEEIKEFTEEDYKKILEALYPKFEPVWDNAQVCPKCKELGMPVWQESSTARMCSNCKYVEERK